MRKFILFISMLFVSEYIAQPCSSFQVAITANQVANTTYQFIATANNATTNFIWYFGDEDQDHGPQTTRTFPGPGTYQVCLTGWFINNASQDTCWTENCTAIVVGNDVCETLVAGFNVNTQLNFAYFNNTTTGAGPQTSYSWDFGDGTSSTLQNPDMHTYNSGVYVVCLTVVSYLEQNGMVIPCTDEYCQTIQIGGGPNPCEDFQVEMEWTAGNNGVYYFNASSSNPNTSFIWYFDQGSQAYGSEVVYAFQEPGTHYVCVTGWYINTASQDTCWTEDCESIVVGNGDPCTALSANFSAFTNSGGTNFSNATTGTGFSTTWHWSFGDGSSSSEAQPTHNYATPGTYTVCLTAISIFEPNGLTCLDSICQTIIVQEISNCNGAEACIIVNNNGNGSFLFENCSNPILNSQFMWDFGDGGTENNVYADHTYTEPGTYTVCLTMYWQNCVDSTCTTVVVGGGNPCDELDADFYYSGGIQGMNFGHPNVHLDWTYFWNFGDGSTSYGPSPYHTYPGPGTYQTCLTVWTWDPVNQDTCFADHCEFIVIQGSGWPCDNLNANFTHTTTPNGTFFSNGTAGTGFQTNWSWTFGDGTTSDNPQPTHNYPGPGTYYTCLTVVSLYEYQGQVITCTDSICHDVSIQGGDPCDFLQTCFVPSQLSTNAFFFNNCTPNETGTTFTWIFGDGTVSNEFAPIHEFPGGNGTYTVCLMAEWQNCFDSTCTVISYGGPVQCDSFSTWFDVVYGNATVFFEPHSNTNASGYIWDLGDGTTGTGNVQTHIYEPPGPYTVCLSAYYWDPALQDTCWTEYCQPIYPFGPQGIDDILTNDAFTVYPRPATDVLTIDGPPLKQGALLELYSMDGRIEHQERIPSLPYQLNVSRFASAVHLLQIEVDGKRFNYRVVVE